jgi:hypothetical protein
MPNHFKKPAPTIQKVAQPSQANPLARIASTQLSMLNNFKVRRAEQSATVSTRLTEIEAIKAQASALVVAEVESQATLLRADRAREHATSLAAITDELITAHRAITLEQGDGRVAGSLANIHARNDQRDEIYKIAASGKLSNDDLAALEATIQDVHAENESRQDEAYQAQKRLTDRNLIELGLGPASSVRNF